MQERREEENSPGALPVSSCAWNELKQLDRKGERLGGSDRISRVFGARYYLPLKPNNLWPLEAQYEAGPLWERVDDSLEEERPLLTAVTLDMNCADLVLGGLSPAARWSQGSRGGRETGWLAPNACWVR